MLRNELMTQDLSGQVALVTGAARRVGKVIAQALAKQGVNIMIHYNRADDDTVRDTLQDIKSEGVDAFCHPSRHQPTPRCSASHVCATRAFWAFEYVGE
jgi:NAD(P)-dependent dehydrogenase (short-subunit alcohol dehydrogenase family)